MNLLLLIYAMIAGLTGFNAGPSAIARAAAMAESGSLFAVSEAPDQVSIALKALATRAIGPNAIPAVMAPDARRMAIVAPAQAMVVTCRAAPERRRE